MSPTFTTLSRPERLADRVVAMLESEIRSGGLRPGSRLPAEHQLSTSLGVSRSVVREGLAKLKADGLVESRQGAGLFVAARPDAASFRLSHGGLLDLAELTQIFELRLAVEVAAAELAAGRRQPADVAAIEMACAAMDRAVDQECDGSDLDDEFHRTIASASHNPYIARFVCFVSGPFRDTRRPSWTEQGHARGMAAAAQEEHRAMLAAIVAGQSDRAGEAARRHLLRSAARTGVAPTLAASAEPPASSTSVSASANSPSHRSTPRSTAPR